MRSADQQIIQRTSVVDNTRESNTPQGIDVGIDSEGSAATRQMHSAMQQNRPLLSPSPFGCHQLAPEDLHREGLQRGAGDGARTRRSACLEGRRSRFRRSLGLHRPYSGFYTVQMHCERAWQKMHCLTRIFFHLPSQRSSFLFFVNRAIPSQAL